jgi:DNA-directed RNA polymerase specialized sigma24 family protein
MITRQQIEQYTSLKREIAMLEDQIYEAGRAGEFATDMVKGSMHEIPYAMHNVVISGYTSQHVPKLQKRKAALEAQCAAVEMFVEGISDSIMRQLFIRRYIEGRGIAYAAQSVGYSERQARRLMNRFFEKMSGDVR